nr:hypothetical protein [Xanthomonadales bacterium]
MFPQAALSIGVGLTRCLCLLIGLFATSSAWAQTFSNTDAIAIPMVGSTGIASPYPSPITVSGVGGTVGQVVVTLTGYSHTFPDDVDVLLVGPTGARMVLLSDVGGSADAVDLTLVFDDTAADPALDNGPLVSGTYRPTNIGATDTFASPAPAAPYDSALSVFNGTDPNGVWQLFVVDDLTGDSGSFAGGWSLTITASCPSTVVSNGNDSGAGSLRQVIADACAGSTITFAPGVSTVSLTSGELVINKNLTIQGPGANLLTIDANNTSRVFFIDPAVTASEISGVTITRGNGVGAVLSGRGGGILVRGVLTLRNSVVTANSAGTIGAGISVGGPSAEPGTLLLLQSLVSANTGLGIQLAGGTMTLENCTVSGNNGIGISRATGSATIRSCTVTGNAGVGISSLGGGTFGNSVVFGNNPDVALATSAGNNLIGTTGFSVTIQLTDLLGVNPRLSALGNYGGPTPTFALLPGSPAINAGNNSGAPSTDQRGIARPQLDIVDIGAFESRGFTLTRTSGDAQSTLVNTAFAAPLVATVASANGEPVEGGVVSFTVPGAGASATLGSASAVIAANGEASTTATANGSTGTYAVTANASGNLGGALSYGLTNRELSADLSITKTDGSATEVPGTPVTYMIVASNAGPDPVTGATVVDTFPANITGVNWTCVGAGGGTCPASGSGNLNASVNLPVGGSVTFTATGTISAGATGTLVNTATVSSSISDPNPANNSATDTDTLTPQADLAISKTDGQTSVGAGTSTTYTITASNAGPSNAPDSTVADTFPASCTSVSWTCAGAGGGTCTAGGSGNISDSVNLPSGGSVTYTAVCAVSTAATGTLSNTATVTAAGGISDPTLGNNSATDTNTITDFPTLAINDVSISEGDSGTQTLNFTVTRTGTTASAVGFSFTTADDTATAGSDYVAVSGTGSIPAGGATGTTQVSVTINGDAVFENTETFFVNLSAPTNAMIADGQGIGTITNDDTAPTLAIN